MAVAHSIKATKTPRHRKGEVLLGEDWVSPEALADQELRAGRGRRGLVALNHSPLARKIVLFNMLAIVVMVAGVLFLNPFRDSLVLQREQGIVAEAHLVADVFEARLAGKIGVGLKEGMDVNAALAELDVGPGVEVFVFDTFGGVLGHVVSDAAPPQGDGRSTIITDFLNLIWEGVSGLLTAGDKGEDSRAPEALARDLYGAARAGESVVNTARSAEGGTLFTVATPIWNAGEVMGVVALASAEGEIDRLVRNEREQVFADVRDCAAGVDRPQPRAGVDHRQSACRSGCGSRTGAGP